MALIDTALVVAHLLQAPNAVLNAAHPAAGLPQLQRVLFGSAAMGFGDLFIAGVVGAMLASRPAQQRRAAFLVAGLALALDLFFFVIDELPATVPVALALVIVDAISQRAWRPRRSLSPAGETAPS
jgi:hypothetical protein